MGAKGVFTKDAGLYGRRVLVKAKIIKNKSQQSIGRIKMSIKADNSTSKYFKAQT